MRKLINKAKKMLEWLINKAKKVLEWLVNNGREAREATKYSWHKQSPKNKKKALFSVCLVLISTCAIYLSWGDYILPMLQKKETSFANDIFLLAGILFLVFYFYCTGHLFWFCTYTGKDIVRGIRFKKYFSSLPPTNKLAMAPFQARVGSQMALRANHLNELFGQKKKFELEMVNSETAIEKIPQLEKNWEEKEKEIKKRKRAFHKSRKIAIKYGFSVGDLKSYTESK